MSIVRFTCTIRRLLTKTYLSDLRLLLDLGGRVPAACRPTTPSSLKTRSFSPGLQANFHWFIDSFILFTAGTDFLSEKKLKQICKILGKFVDLPWISCDQMSSSVCHCLPLCVHKQRKFSLLMIFLLWMHSWWMDEVDKCIKYQ